MPNIGLFQSFPKANRLQPYFELSDLHILCDNQYGIRKNRFTSHALIDLFVEMSSPVDRKEHAFGVFFESLLWFWCPDQQQERPAGLHDNFLGRVPI